MASGAEPSAVYGVDGALDTLLKQRTIWPEVDPHGLEAAKLGGAQAIRTRARAAAR